MKRGMILFSIAAMLAVLARCQTAMIALDDIPGTTLVCVTNYGPQVVSLTARVTGLEGSSNDWSKTVSNLAALSNNVSALSSSVDATNAMFSAWFSGLFSLTSRWETAYGWGDWHPAVAQKLDSSATNGWETGAHQAWLTNETDTAALAALAAHAAYWPPNATASSWFTFTTNANEITITVYDDIGGGTDVVIPDYINGWPVTTIGVQAFSGSYVTSIGGAGNVVTVGDYAFYDCISLASVLLPQARTIGDRAFGYCPLLTSISLPQVLTVGSSAFGYCYLLTSVSLPQVLTVGSGAFAGCTSLTSVYFNNDAPTIGAGIFAGIAPNQVTNYVTNPQATSWGAKLGDMPVVRLPLYTAAITLGGVERTDWPEADVSGLAPTNSPTILNPTIHGWIALPQSAPTNLVLRLVSSNEHIIVQEVYQ